MKLSFQIAVGVVLGVGLLALVSCESTEDQAKVNAMRAEITADTMMKNLVYKQDSKGNCFVIYVNPYTNAGNTMATVPCDQKDNNL